MRGPFIILSPIAKSHPFDERKAKVGSEEDPLKIGRAVARVKAAKDNGMFDCKVLSRNHAVIWCKDGEFYLKDTRSSNGTFVNNDRLAVAGEESEAKSIFTGDIIQFGVEIVENANKVAHCCIYAMIQLFDAEGQLIEVSNTHIASTDTPIDGINCYPSLVNSHQLFQMQQYISEAMFREESRQKKMIELEDILEATEVTLEAARKAIVNEERLLARIESLEYQLAVYGKSATSEKNRDELLIALEDKSKFESVTNESLRRAQEEKAEAELRLADIDRSLVNTEEDCARLRHRLSIMEVELQNMVSAYDEKVMDGERYKTMAVDFEKKNNDLLYKLSEMEDAVKHNEVKIAESNDKVFSANQDVRERAIQCLMELVRGSEAADLTESKLRQIFDLEFDQHLRIAPKTISAEKDVNLPELSSLADDLSQVVNTEMDQAFVEAEVEPKKNGASCCNCLTLMEQLRCTKDEIQCLIQQRDQMQETIETVRHEEGRHVQSLEFVAHQSAGAEPRVVAESLDAPADPALPTPEDPLTYTMLLLSLVPLLAMLLCVLRPLHARFCNSRNMKME